MWLQKSNPSFFIGFVVHLVKIVQGVGEFSA